MRIHSCVTLACALDCTLACTLTLLASGCLLDPADHEIEEEAGRELPSQPLPLEDSPTAYGMLRVVNELGFAALDRDVGLDRQAAQSILAHRMGLDGYLGTADDRYVEDLAELDALYWLGEQNLWTIQRFALREGYAPEAVPSGCEPGLAEALAGCRRFVAETGASAGGRAASVDASWSCVEAEGSPTVAEFFEREGVPGYVVPALGYHAMLCGGAQADEGLAICTLGVAGLAAHALPECVAAGG